MLQPAAGLFELTQATNTEETFPSWSYLSISSNLNVYSVVELASGADIQKPLEIYGIQTNSQYSFKVRF